MAYRGEDELEKERLRKEAEHDAEIALDRQHAQEKARMEAHDRTARQDIERLERESETIERDIRALDLEDKQLEATIRMGKRSSTGDAERSLRESERTLEDLQEDLNAVVHKEDELRDEERRLERSISEAKRSVGEAERNVRDTDDTSDKVRRAASRREDHLTQKSVLTRKVEDLKRRIDVLRRGLSSR